MTENIKQITKSTFFVLIALFIILSPAYRHIFDKKYYPLRGWVMFSSVAREICEVKYEDVLSKTPLNRSKYLSELKNDLRLKQEKQVLKEFNLLCENSRLYNKKIRATYRCSAENNWSSVVSVHDICDVEW